MVAIVSDYASRLEDINKFLFKIADREAPLYKMFGDLSNPVSAIKHEWVDKTLVGFTDTLNVALTSSTATIITVNGGTNTPKRYIGGVTWLRFEGSDEIALVTSVITTVTNTAQLVITRGYQSTTASTYAKNATIKIMTNARTEGFTADRDDSQKGVRRYNLTQIFERELELTTSSQAVDTVGRENRLDQQAADLTPELIKEVEQAIIFGLRTETADLSLRTMGGLRYWANTLGTETNAGGNDITFSMIDDVLESILTKGGDAGKIMALCSIKQQRKLNALKEARIIGGGVDQKEVRMTNFVQYYDFGRAGVEVLFHRDLMPDEIYFFQKDKFKLRPLKGQQWTREPLAKTGHSDKEMILGEYTLEAFNAQELLYRYHKLGTGV